MSKIFLTRTQRVLSGKLKYAVLATVFLATVSLAEAQHSGKMYQIGLLALATPEQYAPLRKVLEEGLRGLGYVEGKNIVFERRFADGKTERLADLAAELVRLKLDVMVTGTNSEIAASRKPRRRSPLSWRTPTTS
jgi:ABC-type uncharacterized transport system substrate-binding protein